MDRHSIIFVTDDRQRNLAKELAYKIESISLSEAAESAFGSRVIATAEHIILPTPAVKIVGDRQFDRIRCYWKKGQTVFGGKIPEELRGTLDGQGICWCDLMDDPVVTEKNAAITAEAVVAEVISRSARSVEGQKIVITGFGRCARAAAWRLAALGANITVLARSRENRRAARGRGYSAVAFAYGPEEVCAAQTVINTVPDMVVTERMFREMCPDTLVLDIASAPGGCDREAAGKYGIEVEMLPGLPGRYTTKSSAKVLADAIRQKTQTTAGRKEEKTWIFQILPSDSA